VALALGAGWIGRTVLEEKGWRDPFHEGPPAVASRVPDADADGDVPAEAFAREPDALEEKAGEVEGRADGRESAGETGTDRPAVSKDGVAPSSVIDEARKRGAEGNTPADPESATPKRSGALAQAEEPRAEDAVGEVSAAGQLEATAEAGRQDARAKSVQQVQDPWHALPEARLAADDLEAAGCYRLEYSWSPGVADLPGTLELVTAEPKGRTGESIFAVLHRGGRALGLSEAIWTSPHPDSVWLQLVSGQDRDVFTVRAGRSGPDWDGEGRVLRPGGPVSVGQTRGAVRLVRIGCEPS
jgi:hypothetical protein